MSRIEELRSRGASSLEQSLGFVEAGGNPLAQVRARVLVDLETADRGVEVLSALQRESGSFPRLGQVFGADLDQALAAWDGDEQILGSLEAISVLADWKQLYTPCAEHLTDSLRGEQWRDGGWGSGLPGRSDHPMRIVATGLLAGFLGRSRSARPEVLAAAGVYLHPFWSVDRIREGGWPTVTAFASYFTNVFDEGAEEALPWCGRELARGLSQAEYSAAMILRSLFYCEAESLPGTEFDTLGLLETLLDEQCPDGGFAHASQPIGERIGPTLDAMMCVLRLCRAGAPETAQ